ncbi:MAG TPA: hypothetical protein VFX70_02915 [Mycobacteriales bacterium]|nr:hypothetical protein [Mycobacteriales bacterium]
MRRTVYVGRGEGRRLTPRRRTGVYRVCWLLLVGPLGAGAAVAGWRLAGAAAGPAMRAGYAVVVFGLVAVIAGLSHSDRGGRR